MNNRDLLMKGFAERLQFAAKKKGWTLAELARRSGVPKTTIHHWTCGKVPGLTQVGKVANTLGVPLHELIYGKPDPHLESKSESAVLSGVYRIHLEKIRDQ